MMDALGYALREVRINRANIAGLTLAVAISCSVLFFQELRIRELECTVHRLKKRRV